MPKFLYHDHMLLNCDRIDRILLRSSASPKETNNETPHAVVADGRDESDAIFTGTKAQCEAFMSRLLIRLTGSDVIDCDSIAGEILKTIRV